MRNQLGLYQPAQRPLTEHEMMHEALDYVITELPSEHLLRAFDPGEVFSRENIHNFINLAMHRMVQEGLITTEQSKHGRIGVIVRATPHGLRVAQYPGGYQGYSDDQRRASEQERRAKTNAEQLNQEAAKATIDAASAASQSVKASERAMRLSVVGLIVSSAIAMASIAVQIISNNNSATELALAKSQIKELQRQVASLAAHPTPKAPAPSH